MKKMVIVPIIIALLAVAVFMTLKESGDKEKFRTEKVIRGDITDVVSATGTINAVTTVLVGTQVSGTIKDIYVDFNSPVKKGQLIAEVDPVVFEAQVEQAMANRLAAIANLEKSDAALIDAKRTLERNRELFSKNFIAKSDVDTSETNYDTAKAQINAAGAQVAQAEAALKLADINLRHTEVFSPVDGIVVSRNVDVGQTVAASFQTPTLFSIAQDLTRMQINANIDEADIGRIKTGQTADFTVDAYPETPFGGRVSQIRIAPIIVQNVVTYDVVIRVDNPDLKLKPGMTANVSIIISGKKDVLKVPVAALRFRPSETVRTAPDKGSGVWILENNIPRRIPVTTGITESKYTEIISADITEGQDVIVESLTNTKNDKAIPAPRPFF